ncbi:type II toxin-antitoxin system RelE/ParE family toxin [Clostridium algidicarnis]|uniref:type II toxin-antitoxin system RelE/ParE family toxin n=1 Tax=Clostridium algidicarnis TaxID=37659 RepID=UPI001C0C3599|nr:type II toxin-antitoxin system RelE/ParE family toxin [Clostridium algidicarnis]MBU3209038.1 type II toxin-antitoxin system RelE/ParE family toxin [Clostridium algidicarnis]MBU3228760.1 type II toxin-antitoxin system RelE/ParE family toxin [Clostridium algidicarnis]MBU3252304.1 type II toxin-antitoxin system RelE/ParE family toxin [Clostridium algidicarnis]
MSMYDIQITEPAKKDLYDIGSYISKELLEPEIAKKVISEIAKGVNWREGFDV